MARGGPSRRLTSRLQTKDHNAKQAQARKERKGNADGATGLSSIHDVFEYVTKQQEAGRGAASLSEKRDNRMTRRVERNDTGLQTYGGKLRSRDGDNDIDEEEDRIPRYQTGPYDEQTEEGGVRSEDDEEIDSDEAFGESDEEEFEGWKFGKGNTTRPDKGVEGEEVDENDEEQEEQEEQDDDEGNEDDDGSEQDDLMDISKLLDAGSDEESDVEGNDSADDRLQRKMEGISAGLKRSAEEDEEGPSRIAKRRILLERSEAVPEGEWSAPGAGNGALTIDDLLAPLREQGGTQFTALRDTAKLLKRKGGKQAIASKRRRGELQAPLPSILQDRLDRSAAYGETKEEVQGWQPTIKRIREAEHLSFPLQQDPVVKPSTSLMVSQFKPSNSFEQDVAAMLEKEGLSEKRLAEAEELKMNERGMSAEEIQERRAELRRTRELLFREEQKAKRVGKIKSKTYRKIARKHRERELEKAKEAGLLLGGHDDEEEDREAEQDKAARLRAKERATLKHKNAGKWAQNIVALHGSHDMPEARNAIEEQLRKGEQLRRRIQGQDSEDEVDGESAEENNEESGSDEGDALNELRALQKDQENENTQEEEAAKGVWGMKFMKDARERKARQTRDKIDEFDQQMQAMDKSSGESENEDGDNDVDANIRPVGTASGRMVFTSMKSLPEESRTDDEQGNKKTAAPLISSEPIVVEDPRILSVSEKDEVNPWLTGKATAKLSRKKNESTVSKESSAQSKAANRIQKHISKGDKERQEALVDAQLEIDPEAKLAMRSVMPASKKTEDARREGASVETELDEEHDDEDDDADSLFDEPVAIRGSGPAAIRQRDLVAEAFAGDNITADFTAEKEAAMEADAPQTIDTMLPGWGSWGGKGVRVNKKKAEEQKKKFAKTTSGLDPTKRKDANMTNVIINQKRDKKADKYRGKDVPYPYTSRAQYEMAMRNPLGPEWNTRTQHQKLTLPKITTKPGKAIKPIERLF